MSSISQSTEQSACDYKVRSHSVSHSRLYCLFNHTKKHPNDVRAHVFIPIHTKKHPNDIIGHVFFPFTTNSTRHMSIYTPFMRTHSFSLPCAHDRWEPFVEACISQGRVDEALKYTAKIGDYALRAELCLKMDRFREAAQAAGMYAC